MRVALALGSGGARGYAHIGVINELQDRGYEVVGVSGSSMGALVGGLHAAGKLDEFADWARTLTQRAVLRLLDPSITAAGILRAEKILDAVRDIIGDATIEGLPIPYTAVATDLIAGKSVWLQRGPLDSAIRASIAIPGVIAPHVLNGRLLGDGGILDPLPMAPIAAVNADLTIAVSLSGGDPGTAPTPEDPERRPTTEWLNRMMRSTSAVLDTASVRAMLDRPTARAVLSRFGASIPPEDSSEPVDDEGADGSGRRSRRTRGTRAGRCAEAGQLRGDEPHHRHRPGRAGSAHTRRLSARPADRGTAHGMPEPGIPPRRRGHRGGAGADRPGARRLNQPFRKAATSAATRRP